MHVVQVAFDDSYPTGGLAVTPADMGMRAHIDAIVPAGASPYGSGAYTTQWSSPYLLAISLGDGKEAGDTTDLSAMTINVLAIGR